MIKEFENSTKARVVYVTKSGSKLYGTDTPESDTDLKGIFIPSKESVLMKVDINHYVKNTNNDKIKNSSEDVDITLYSIYTFFDNLTKGETGAIDLLFSMFREDTITYKDNEFLEFMKSNYLDFLSSNMKSFIGYALGQTKKFGIKGARYNELNNFINSFSIDWGTNHKSSLSIKYEEIKEYIKDNNCKYIKFVTQQADRDIKGNEKEYISVLGKLFLGTVSLEYFYDNINKLYNQFGNRVKTTANTITKTDFKALSHSYRIASEVKELLKTHFIKFPLKEASKIKDIKQGKCDVETIINEIADILEEVDLLLITASLPKEVDKIELRQHILQFLK